MNEKGLVIIYNNNVEVKLIDNNFWMTQDQLVSLYQSSKSNISDHIKHIISEGELDESSTVRKFRIVQKEGNREVVRNINHYNLDMIIAIGYRVRSNISSFRLCKIKCTGRLTDILLPKSSKKEQMLLHFNELLLIEKKDNK